MFDVKLKEHWLTSEAKSRGIDEHILELLLRHVRNQRMPFGKILSYPLNKAINNGFLWDESPEGYSFWNAISAGGSVCPSLSISAMSMVANVWYIDFKEFE